MEKLFTNNRQYLIPLLSYYSWKQRSRTIRSKVARGVRPEQETVLNPKMITTEMLTTEVSYFNKILCISRGDGVKACTVYVGNRTVHLTHVSTDLSRFTRFLPAGACVTGVFLNSSLICCDRFISNASQQLRMLCYTGDLNESMHR